MLECGEREIRMVSKIQPGRAVLERMAMYRLLADITPLRASYHGKFALAAFVGVLIPLAIFTQSVQQLPLARHDQDHEAALAASEPLVPGVTAHRRQLVPR